VLKCMPAKEEGKNKEGKEGREERREGEGRKY
jgi:hypothetical protein